MMTIPIVFCSDNNYIPYMATAIQSVVENSSKEFHYEFYIMVKNITIENKQRLNQMVAGHINFKLEILNVGDYFSKYNLYIDGISEEAYYRLIIPYFLTQYDKVLYLDCDLLCLGDVSELYSFDVTGSMIGCIQGLAEIGWYNSTVDHYWDNLLKIKNPENYFNSGVLLFNTKVFRESITFDDLLKLAVKENWLCYDQDVLNIVCENKITFLPNQWNLINYPSIIHLSEKLKLKYYEAEKLPKIVHFASGYKPWNNSSYVPSAIDFWKYATRTTFSDEIIKKFNSNFTMYVKKETNIKKLPLKKIIQVILGRVKNKLFFRN